MEGNNFLFLLFFNGLVYPVPGLFGSIQRFFSHLYHAPRVTQVASAAELLNMRSDTYTTPMYN